MNSSDLNSHIATVERTLRRDAMLSRARAKAGHVRCELPEDFPADDSAEARMEWSGRSPMRLLIEHFELTVSCIANGVALDEESTVKL